MSNWLRQSTAAILSVGPFLDASDGVTEEVGLAGTMTVKLSKAGGALTPRSSATAIVYDAGGNYLVELNAADTNTLGRLRLQVNDAVTHLPVWEHFTVLPAPVYDALVGTALLPVDAAAVQALVAALSAAVATLAAQLALVKTKTDTIPASGPASAEHYTAVRGAKLDQIGGAVQSVIDPVTVNMESLEALRQQQLTTALYGRK